MRQTNPVAAHFLLTCPFTVYPPVLAFNIWFSVPHTAFNLPAHLFNLVKSFFFTMTSATQLVVEVPRSAAERSNTLRVSAAALVLKPL